MQAANVRMAMPMYEATCQYLSETCTLAILYSNRKAPVIKTAVPQVSYLHLQQQCSYSNSYLTTFNDKEDQVQPQALAAVFYAAFPKLILVLASAFTKLRSYLHFNAMEQTKDITKKNDLLGHVLFSNEHEVVYEMAGRHLNIRHSFLVHKPRKFALQKNAMVSTTVVIHSRVGTFCLHLIKPLFRYLVPQLLKRAVHSLED
jgi:hypothetical protein